MYHFELTVSDLYYMLLDEIETDVIEIDIHSAVRFIF